MYGKPFIEHLEAARSQGSTAGFGSRVPPFGPPLPTPVPQSLVNAMLEPARPPSTTQEAMTAISRVLAATLDNDNREGHEIYLAWLELSGKIERFLNLRKDAHRAELTSKIAELTIAGRRCLETIRELTNQRGGLQADWNVLESRASEARAKLLAVETANPDGNDGTPEAWEESFALPIERQEWEKNRAQARAEVERREAEMRPVQSRMNGLTAQIEAERSELQKIKIERRDLRLELVDGVSRAGGSGLQGPAGRSAIPVVL